jgi:3-phosphoshikimate 1-carboxyvinyltransferase
MPALVVKPAKAMRGKISLPGDKSIAHRSIIISAIAKGKTRIYNFPSNQDCLITLKVFKQLGINISGKPGVHSCLCVEGRGLYGLNKSRLPIFSAESGTTFRLLLGLLAGQNFSTFLTAGTSLSHRPMKRVTEPLRRMGAVIKSQSPKGKAQGAREEYPPVTIRGGRLRSISYKMPVASAQVKSALLLAGLYARGAVRIFEPLKTRNHTELLLKNFAADIKVNGRIISLRGRRELVSPGRINIPGDISSASFFIVAALLLPHSRLVLKSVGLNPTRLGLIRVLKQMGADIKLIRRKSFSSAGEPAGDIIITASRLSGRQVSSSQIPQLIDELPVLMLASCFARGKTTICGVRELRVKETDRILSMQTNLSKMGADIRVTGHGLSQGMPKEKIIINGTGGLKGARVSSYNDHRTAMSLIIAGLVSKGKTVIDDTRCLAKSFPDFLRVLRGALK